MYFESVKQLLFFLISNFAAGKYQEILETGIFSRENIEKFWQQIFFSDKTSKNFSNGYFSLREIQEILETGIFPWENIKKF